MTYLRTTFLSFTLLLSTTVSVAQDSTGYLVLETPVLQTESDTIEIIEFFSYGCPHCYALDPLLHDWEKKHADTVTVIREAPPLNEFWIHRSRAFYAAEQLGYIDKLHTPIFDAIHRDGLKLRKPAKIVDFVESQGVDGDKFQQAMLSDEVKAEIADAMELARSIDITGVPTLLVAGKYVTGTRLAGGHEAVTDILDQLIAKELSN